MGDEWPTYTRVVEFHLLKSLPDAHPIVVKRGRHVICYSYCLIFISERLSNNPSLQEVLWKFCRFKDEKNRLTLRDNPHFYPELPTLPDKYDDSIKIDPTEDFRHADKFYVLTDNPELVYIMTNDVPQFFGKFWYPKSTIIFKGLCFLFLFFPVTYVLPDVCGRLRGGSIVNASFKSTCDGVCKLLLVSTVRDSRNHRGLKPIITQWYPPMVGKCLINCLPMRSYIDSGLCIGAGRATPDSAVRCYIITYLTGSVNVDIAPCPLATNIGKTGVQRGVQNTYTHDRR